LRKNNENNVNEVANYGMDNIGATKKQIGILVVEDNECDALLIKQVISDAKLPCYFHVASDGAEALELLKKQTDHSNAQDIHMVILDINLPKKSGFEVLEQIRKNEELTHIPVIILTSSRSHRDIIRSYKEHANCFLTKPIRLEDFLKTIQIVIDFWLRAAQLPITTDES
jgi:CheY-like chemotaxis protein